MTSDVLIIGNGLFGAVAAAALRRDKHTVTVVDAGREGAASPASGCLMKPSWYSGLGKAVADPALELLQELYGVEELEFRVPSGVTTLVQWVDPARVLGVPEVRGTVARLERDGAGWLARLEEPFEEPLRARRVIVAAGVWTGALTPVEGLVGRAGAAFYWRGVLDHNFIRPWAPFKQVVAFTMDPENGVIWSGDGSALSDRSWNDERRLQSQARCFKAVGDRALLDMRWGWRPYIKGVKPSLLEERQPGLWVNTGGAKNGTIAAGWAAARLREALQ